MQFDHPIAAKEIPELSVGIDLVALAEVAQSFAAFGERYLQRVFSATERSQWPVGDLPLMTRTCALSFAVKEAALKALGLADAGVDWRDMSVQVTGRQATGLSLHGRAAELAGEAGYQHWHVAGSVAADLASAMVCAHRNTTTDVAQTQALGTHIFENTP